LHDFFDIFETIVMQDNHFNRSVVVVVWIRLIFEPDGPTLLPVMKGRACSCCVLLNWGLDVMGTRPCGGGGRYAGGCVVVAGRVDTVGAGGAALLDAGGWGSSVLATLSLSGVCGTVETT
jgi:hypothetical protein